MERRGLRVLLFEKLPGFWVARGLEHDLAVEGRSQASVVEQIHRLVQAHAAFDRRHGRAPLSPFPEAPRRFWRAFERATRLPLAQDSSGDASSFGPIVVAVTAESPWELAGRLSAPQIRQSPARHTAQRGRPVH